MKSSSRLKNFCELCRKQCQDQNGYLCHINSTSHQRRVQQFKTNPQQLIQKYSQQMQGKFIQLLKTKYPGQAKHLQILYQQYEQQAKRFIKFSHTKWKNLGQFGEYLKSGQAKNIKVTGTPPDCYVTYTVNKTMDFIEKNKKLQLQQLKQKEKQLFEKSLQNRVERQRAYEQRQARKFQQQMKKVQKEQQNVVIPDKLQFTFDNWGQTGKRHAFITQEQLQKQAEQQLKKQIQQKNAEHHTDKLVNSNKLLNQFISRQQRLQQNKGNTSSNQSNNKNNTENNPSVKPQQDEDQWITKGIIVKIKPHQIDPAFHNKKTRIISVVQPYIARIKIGTATLQIDQTYLQTVIPKIGNWVMILNGNNKNQKGILQSVSLSEGYGSIQINDNSSEEQNNIVKVPFNWFSKYEEQEEQ